MVILVKIFGRSNRKINGLFRLAVMILLAMAIWLICVIFAANGHKKDVLDPILHRFGYLGNLGDSFLTKQVTHFCCILEGIIVYQKSRIQNC